MYWYLPMIDVPQQTPEVSNQAVDLTGQVTFRTTTDCPIPREWLIAALAAGIGLGYLLWGARRG
jgi:hypothetical protein